MSLTEIKNAINGHSRSTGGLNVIDIRKILSDNGLPVSGTRSDLIDRLKTLSIPPIQQKKVLTIDDLPTDSARKIYHLKPDFLRTMAGLLVSIDREIGGLIDLKQNGDFDRNIYSIGGKSSINMADFDDYEISYHTHPIDPNRYYNIPSHDDILNTVWRSNKGLFQIDIVFAYDGIYVTYIFGKPKLSIKQLSELYIEHGIISAISLQDPSVLDVFNSLTKYGVYILRYSTATGKPSINPIDNWPTQLPLYINPTEPNINLTTRVVRDCDHIPSHIAIFNDECRDSVVQVHERVPEQKSESGSKSGSKSKSKSKWSLWHKDRY
jgi:hypothetical protein